MQTNVTYQEIEQTKAYVTPTGILFRNPQEYIDNFMKSVKADLKDTRFELQGKSENANDDGTLNTAYSRLLVETKLNYVDEFNITGKVIGMVMNLDGAKPEIRVYTGGQVFACSNLCISGAEHIFNANPLTNLESAYGVAEQFRTNAEEDWLKNLKVWKKMQETVYSGSQVNEKLGRMLEVVLTTSSFKGLGTSPIIHAAKELYANAGPYSILGKNECTGWNMYQAITQSLSNTNDIIRTPQKSLIASNLILN